MIHPSSRSSDRCFRRAPPVALWLSNDLPMGRRSGCDGLTVGKEGAVGTIASFGTQRITRGVYLRGRAKRSRHR